MSLSPSPSPSLYNNPYIFSVTHAVTHISWLYICAITDALPSEWEQTIPEQMTLKWFLQDMDIIDFAVVTQPPCTPPPPLRPPPSPTRVQQWWFYCNSLCYCPKALNHIIVVMWKKTCCPNYDSFRISISRLHVLVRAEESQWPLGSYMKPFEKPVH